MSATAKVGVLVALSSLIFLSIAAPSRAQLVKEEVCPYRPQEGIKKSTVGVLRALDKDEQYYYKGVLIVSIQFTAWFYRDSRTLVTVEHSAKGAKLSKQPKPVMLFRSEERDTKADTWVDRNITIEKEYAGEPGLEGLVVLHLSEDVKDVQPLVVRAKPLRRNEPVGALAYLDRTLRFADGNFKPPEASVDPGVSQQEAQSRYLPFELVDKDKKNGVGDRYALVEGTSGGAIVDCEGNVVGVVEGFVSRDMTFAGTTMRITTAWGSANVMGVSPSILLRK